jgi:protein-S-isoprenylcysteine O-methyltransferase Ste14
VRAPWVIVCLWGAFARGWLIFAQFNKKANRSAPGLRRIWQLRVAILIAALVLLWYRRHGGARGLGSAGHLLALHGGATVQWLGVGLSLIGIGFAFWARVHIGRNWGIPMSLRQDHELVTSGPYAYVRHPIYTGIMLAQIGSALAVGVVWLVAFAIAFVYFVFSARTEEKMMVAQFPAAYPAYRHRTKMLIPFVF